MGILTRKQGEQFVISSDHTAGVASTRPPRRLSESYQVWTGSVWSLSTAEALTFESLDDADEYVRTNYQKLSIIA
jgi:hypothetical protein